MPGARNEIETSDSMPTVEQLSAERDHYRKLYLEALERCAMLERGIIVGKKAERFEGETPQLALGVLDMLLGARDAGNCSKYRVVTPTAGGATPLRHARRT